ncbi:S8 family serine peptidase [Flagellimonas zhangzhouensis]|uniref:Peptidase inhibitor I9 n=1 Tax=Flagellimonas zhangzhouensis TaxID=1073328 RepID=A0A1H2UXZ8_9FLAO|nr:S8 family serine peptidase [Allomuricauda zhangzhouensis]SDQ12597.1 Peptidase inhibitor I9 [Allomuricauda zhangzhouensis]SDW60970.1 Peptidase inhibitor I9 [Allomuricauda zhangzhouensis]
MKKPLLKSAVLLASTGMILFSCSDDSQSGLESPENQSILPEEAVIFNQGSYEIDGSYIVVFDQKVTGDVGAKFGTDYKSATGAVKQLATEVLGSLQMKGDLIERVYSKTLTGVSARLSSDQANTLKSDPRVAYIEKDQMFTLAPPPGKGPGGGGGGGTTGQEIPWGIARVNGGATYTGNNVAWIIDSGIESTHEDLNVDVSRGYNAFTNGPDSDLSVDKNGHGTHVAGTVAALDNEIGVVGVAAGATVIPVKVLDRRGSGSYSGVIAGIDFVAANASNGDVANMSLGGGFSQAVNDAVISASSTVKFAIAAGNESSDANGSSPASANGNNIYTISAMSEGDNWASFSNYGNPPVDYCEPGVAIKSTWPGGYNTISGTSMASPHACGLLLLGNISNGGTVSGDPDGDADTIGVN